MAIPQLALEGAQQLLNESISEADIIKKITQRFGIGILAHANQSSIDVEDNLNIFKNLFKQLIECKIQRQLTDIENRKRIFMDTFAVNLHRKMTTQREAEVNGVYVVHDVSINNPAINKFGHSADFTAKRKAQVSSGIAIKSGQENQDMCGDDAMSVDGDISYCSNEMEEIGDKAIQPLKYKESNSSLHLVEKKEEAVHSRMFINRVSESLEDSGSSPAATEMQQQRGLSPTNIRATNMDIIHEAADEESQSSSYY
jgi:hypothetical protein